MTRTVTLLAAGLACLVSLAGCSSDSSAPDPGSSAPSPSRTFAGPAMPAQARGESRESAEAFVGYWVDTLNYATDSGDTAGLRSLAGKQCQTCVGFARTLDEIYGKGGHVESDGWKLESAVPIADQPAKEPAFQLAMKLESQKVFATRTSKPKSYPGGDQAARMVLVRQGDHWVVQRLDI